MALWGCCLLSFQTGLWGGHLYISCEIFPPTFDLILISILGAYVGGEPNKKLILFQDFVKSSERVRKSLSKENLNSFEKWNDAFGDVS